MVRSDDLGVGHAGELGAANGAARLRRRARRDRCRHPGIEHDPERVGTIEAAAAVGIVNANDSFRLAPWRVSSSAATLPLGIGGAAARRRRGGVGLELCRGTTAASRCGGAWRRRGAGGGAGKLPLRCRLTVPAAAALPAPRFALSTFGASAAGVSAGAGEAGAACAPRRPAATAALPVARSGAAIVAGGVTSGFPRLCRRRCRCRRLSMGRGSIVRRRRAGTTLRARWISGAALCCGAWATAPRRRTLLVRLGVGAPMTSST